MGSPGDIEAIVLVGGRGTRLQGVVGDRPKPMADVAGRPFLERLLVALHAQGVRHVVLATGYKGEMVEAYFGDGAHWGVQLTYAQEATPLGTGGAARHALNYINSACVLVLNGDSYCPFDVDRLRTTHRTAGAQATLWLIHMADCRRYGSVEVAQDGRVLAFREKSSHAQSGLINAGIYVFQRATLESLAAGRAVSLETEVFPALIGHGLYGVTAQGPFLDIGTPESYGMAESFFAEGMLR